MSEHEKQPWINIEDEPNLNTNNQRLRWSAVISVFSANLLLLTAGSCMMWGSPTIPQLMSNDTKINPLGAPITTLEVSFIAGIPFASSMIGNIAVAKISDAIGRKKIMMYTSILTALSLFCVAFARHIYLYFICLCILGFSISSSCVNVPIYTAEILDKNSRSKFGCFVGLGIPVGIFIGYIFATFTNVRSLSLIFATPPLLHFLLTHFFIVESPIYLASKGKKNESLKALEYLRGTNITDDVDIEYTSLEKTIRVTHLYKNRPILDMFKTRATRKAFFLSGVLCIGQQASGISIIQTFMASIFNGAGLSLSGNSVGALVGCIQISTYFIAAYTIDKLGRKQLLLFSTSLTSISMFLLSVYFYGKYINSYFIDNIRWLPILSIILFIIGYSMGLGPIPMSLIVELFPDDLRSIGVGVILVGDGLVVFLLNFNFPLLSESYGIHCCMIANGICCMLIFVVVYIFLPETRGKTFNEIQNILGR